MTGTIIQKGNEMPKQKNHSMGKETLSLIENDLGKLRQVESKEVMKFETVVEGNAGSLWRWFNDGGQPSFALYTENSSLARRISSWRSSRMVATYHRQDGIQFAWQLVVPKANLKRVLKAIGIHFVTTKRRLTPAQSAALQEGRERLFAQVREVREFP